MPAPVIVPNLGDSILEVTISDWRIGIGDAIALDGNVVEVESDKATVDIPAPVGGVLTQILKQPGESAKVGEVIGYIDESAAPTPKAAKPAGPAAPAAPASPASVAATSATASGQPGFVMPSAARVMVEQNLPAGSVAGSGPGGRVLKEDAVKAATAPAAPPAAAPAPRPASESKATVIVPAATGTALTVERSQKRQRMSPIRRRIAQRLLEAQHSAALLTTFNEVDMTAVMALRKQYQDGFVERYGVKLGFMSFFVKATVDALQAFPQINAEIQGDEIVIHNYCDIGVAIGGGQGLVVPVLRNAERMTFAQIEQAIGDFAKRAQAGSLKPQELQGGTFTISNGGVYGSMMSTPIVNPPQSGVLGMHAIIDRPIAKDGQVVIRPMMYLALTYDHRVVDGREAVTFLKRIKDCIENPLRLMLEV